MLSQPSARRSDASCKWQPAQLIPTSPGVSGRSAIYEAADAAFGIHHETARRYEPQAIPSCRSLSNYCEHADSTARRPTVRGRATGPGILSARIRAVLDCSAYSVYALPLPVGLRDWRNTTADMIFHGLVRSGFDRLSCISGSLPRYWRLSSGIELWRRDPPQDFYLELCCHAGAVAAAGSTAVFPTDCRGLRSGHLADRFRQRNFQDSLNVCASKYSFG